MKASPFGQRFACGDRYCPGERVLPEHPTRGKRSVRAVCFRCEQKTTHRAIGRVGGTIRGSV